MVAPLQACATLGNLINRSGLARRQGGGGGGVAACILMCCGYCASNLVRLVRFFNHYAYTHVAIYGYAMVPAAKATYGLVKGVGLLPLMGNRLLQGVITVGCALAGGLGAGIAALFLLLSPTLRELMTWGSPTPVSYEWALVWLCFTIGWLVSLPLLEIAQSVVCALFVCLAEQPEVMQLTRPDLFNEICAAYEMMTGKSFLDVVQEKRDGGSGSESGSEYAYDYQYEYDSADEAQKQSPK